MCLCVRLSLCLFPRGRLVTRHLSFFCPLSLQSSITTLTHCYRTHFGFSQSPESRVQSSPVLPVRPRNPPSAHLHPPDAFSLIAIEEDLRGRDIGCVNHLLSAFSHTHPSRLPSSCCFCFAPSALASPWLGLIIPRPFLPGHYHPVLHRPSSPPFHILSSHSPSLASGCTCLLSPGSIFLLFLSAWDRSHSSPHDLPHCTAQHSAVPCGSIGTFSQSVCLSHSLASRLAHSLAGSHLSNGACK